MAPAVERRLIVANVFIETAVKEIVALQPRSLALAGGYTPRPVYERLALTDLPWADIDVFMGDERCVPPDDPASNYGMARAALLDRVPARVHPPPAPGCDAEAYERELTSVFGTAMPAFDLVILGLGADGHTASLFPGSPALAVRDRAVVRVEAPDHARLTLTLPALSAAKTALFLVEGAGKREALAKLIAGDATIPATQVTAASIVIIADPAAAAT
jgi:6-phosphogluconolactonase